MKSRSSTKQALFLVQTPFQCLCMMEAIHHFCIEEYDVFVPKAGGLLNEQMVNRLLEEQHIPYVSISADSWKGNVYKWLFKRHLKYKRVFVGYYYSHIERAMAVVMSCKGGQMLFLDDGTQALEVFSSKCRRLYSDWKIALRALPFVFLGRIKLLKKPIFFTIYDVNSRKYLIEKNTFSSFLNFSNQKPSGIYIIGANSSALHFSSYSYIQLLESLISKIKPKVAEEQVFYCPHRRDNNNSSLVDLFNNNEIQIFDTKVSVEYDFLTLHLYPKYIFGFTSNALFTLHKLFEKAQVFTVYYEIEPDSANRETSIIRSKLNEYGIDSIHVI